jgi:hypothetical protein
MSMAWSFHTASSPSLASITDPNATAAQLLDDPDLTNALRLPSAALLDFVSRPDILEGLLDWVLTTNFKDFPHSARGTRQALAIFTSQAKPLQKKLFTQELTISRLNSFPDTAFSSDERICGHYQRLVEAFVQSNQSKGLSQLTTLFDFLSRRLSCLGLRDLFVTLMCTENSALTLSSDLFSVLLDGLATPNAYFVITALHSVVKRSPYQIANYLQTPEIVNKLLDACLPSATYDAVVASECFQVLRLLQAGGLALPRAAEFAVAARPADCSLAFCARVFPDGVASLVPRLFSCPPDTFLNAAIFDAFALLPPPAQAAAAAEHDLPGRIVAAFGSSFANGHITKLAELLRALDPQPEVLQTDAWRRFAAEGLHARVVDRERVFVQSAPTSDVSDGPTGEADIVSMSSDGSYSDDDEAAKSEPRTFEGPGSSDEERESMSSDEDDGLGGQLAASPIRASFGEVAPPIPSCDFDSEDEDAFEGAEARTPALPRRRVLDDDEDDEDGPAEVRVAAEEVEPALPDVEEAGQDGSADVKEGAEDGGQ